MGRDHYRGKGHTRTIPLGEIIDLYYDLINALKLVHTSEETVELIQDLLTANEILNLATRLRIAKLLLLGKTQREISEKLHCSIATVTKVSIWIEHGGKGFKNVISKLPVKYKLPQNKHYNTPLQYHLPQSLMDLVQYSLAKKQNRKLKDFSYKVSSKKLSDKDLQKTVSNSYRTKIQNRYQKI